MLKCVVWMPEKRWNFKANEFCNNNFKVTVCNTNKIVKSRGWKKRAFYTCKECRLEMSQDSENTKMTIVKRKKDKKWWQWLQFIALLLDFVFHSHLACCIGWMKYCQLILQLSNFNENLLQRENLLYWATSK